MSAPAPRIVFAEDDTVFRSSIIRALDALAPELIITPAETAGRAVALARTLRPEIILLDLALDAGGDPRVGLELIPELLGIDDAFRIIVLTGSRAKDFGIQALQLGAATFIEKPVHPPHLLALIEDGFRCATIRREARTSRVESSAIEMVGVVCDPEGAMRPALEQARFAGSTAQPVLLVGETGTGKGVLAQAIHTLRFPAGAPFVRLQPSFGSFDLASSELFGHERGAFTGASAERRGLLEEAHRGTLFIDEVDELPSQLQVALLNALQERRFRRVGSNRERTSDFRLIAATNRPLETLVHASRLREDFYHRIAHCVIQIPPLRQRQSDILLLAEDFLLQVVTREKLAVDGFSAAAEDFLVRHPWPGNARQLQGAIEGAVFRARFERARRVEPQHFQLRRRDGAASAPGSFREQVRAFELRLIMEALERCSGNQVEAARFLGLDRSSMRRMLARSGASEMRVVRADARQAPRSLAAQTAAHRRDDNGSR